MKALRILVVEDDTMIGMVLADMLEQMGHEVCAIEATEADAVTAAVRCRPDLMIVDAQLGDGSGIAAVEKIRRTGSIPHLFVSGDISSAKALRPGAVVIQSVFTKLTLRGPFNAQLAPRPHLEVANRRRTRRQQWAGTAKSGGHVSVLLHFWSGTGRRSCGTGGRGSRLGGAAAPGRLFLWFHHVIDQSGMDI
jgi:CheY-like chemotaxis protein